MRSIVHNETQDGKRPADLHFAVVTRYVDRYIESLRLDVVTPLDLVNAINHGQGLKGTTAEMFDVNVEHINMKSWKTEQRKKAKDSSFKVIGRCNVIEYSWQESTSDTVIAYSRAYKYSHKIRWGFKQNSSQRLSSSPVIEQEAEDEDGNRDGNSECAEGDVVAGETTAVNRSIDDGIGNGADCEYVMHEGHIIFEGVMTGVKLMTSGTSARDATPSESIANRLLDRMEFGRTAPALFSHNDAVDAAEYGAESLGSVESDSEYSDKEVDTATNNKYRYNGMCYYCRRCGQSYME